MSESSSILFKLVPKDLFERGQAIVAEPRTILTRIEGPAAMPTRVVGLNRVIPLSFSMVALVDLVGAGGFGTDATGELTRMEMGLGRRDRAGAAA